MTTDAEFDLRLHAASGIRTDDLPALPEAFLAALHNSSADPASARPRAVPAPAPEPATVLAARQLVADAHARRHRPLVTRRRAALATSAAAVAAAAAALVLGVTTAGAPEDGPAGSDPRTVDLLLADYSLTPTTGTDQQKAEAQVACAAEMAHTVAGQGPAYADQSPATITEVRDAWTLSIFDGQRNAALCLVHSDATGGSVEGINVRAALAGSPAQGITTASVTHARLTDPQATAYTAVAGRAAHNVTGVTLRLGNGELVTATVRNGWWAAWWPTAGRDDLANFQTTFTTGPGAQPSDGGRIVTRVIPGG